jgi:putative ABC transport system permease protein
MWIRETLRSGFKSLSHNRMRSFLTMLGVIIGVFSVVMLTSIGEGVKRQVTSQVESLGANLLYVLPGKIEVNSPRGQSRLGVTMNEFGQTKSSLVYEDVLALKDQNQLPAVTGVYNGVDRLDALKLMVSTTGVDEDIDPIREFSFTYGRFIDKNERVAQAAVAVIGSEVNNKLFAGKNSVGKVFNLNGKPYRVVGVLKYKKPQNLGQRGDNLNIKLYLPITEMINRAKNKNIDQIIAQAGSSEAVQPAEKMIYQTLKKRHPTEDFSVIKQQDMLDVINNILGILTAALGGIAAISLLVGGIGIMNIMLVSVAERTREIGVRKAIGAKRRDILIQFLIEAVALSLTGGIFGLLAGIGGARLLPSLFPMIHTAISAPAALTALLFAFLVGGFFGVYPATKAAELDPIEALRSE